MTGKAMRLPIYQVDAFTDRVFAGNPAAVVPLESWLPDAQLQAIAAENNLAETAFFIRSGQGARGGYELRWFTPAVEVDLCGHATLATAFVISTILEPGRERMKLGPAREVVERLATPVIEDLPFSSGDTVLAFVNGMGGTPQLELYLVYNELRALLDQRGITIGRSLVGSYITSLEMAGCSITLLRLDDELTRLWDAPVHTAGLRWGA